MEPMGPNELMSTGRESSRAGIQAVSARPIVQGRAMIDALEAAEDAGSRDWLALFWRRRWWVIGGTVVGIIGSFVALQGAVPVYSSGSQLYIQQQGLRANDGVRLVGPTDNLLTQAEVIRSTEVLRAASLLPSMREAPTVSASENPVGLLKQMLSVTVNDKTDIITVSARTSRPEEAAVVVNSVVEAYIDFQTKSKKNTAADVLRILKNEKDNREKEVESLYTKMIAFKREKLTGTPAMAAPAGQPGGEAAAAGTAGANVSDVGQALAQVQLQKLDIDVLATSVREAGDDDAKIREIMMAQPPAVLQDLAIAPADADVASALKSARLEAIRLRAQVGPSNDRLMMLERQIEMMQGEQRSADSQGAKLFRIGVLLKQEWLARKEQQLRARYDQQQRDQLALSGDAMEFAKMQSELRRAEQMCDIIDQRIKDLNVNEETGGMTTNILEVAKPNGAPVSPVPVKYLMMGVAFGLIGGAAAGFLRDWSDPRLRSVEDIRSAIDAPILGVVPRIRGRSERHGLEVFKAPRSKIAEAYKSIRTAVYFESPNPNAKSLLITSPSPGDGKTTLATNLATAMAQAGRRVLMIDADCRRPAQHKVFGVKNIEGVTKYLSGETDDPTPLITRTPVDGLDFMPCGRIPENPSELVSSPRFAELLRWAASRYDMVLIDSPPVVPVTDARILSAVCDQTLLVLRADQTSRQMAAYAHDLLVRVNSNLLGVVVNDVHATRHGYNYGYYYDYAYESHRNEPPPGDSNGTAAAGSNGRVRKSAPSLT